MRSPLIQPPPSDSSAANPAGERQVFPDWQQKQYLHSMFSVHYEKLDNDRYPDVEWTSAGEVISKI